MELRYYYIEDVLFKISQSRQINFIISAFFVLQKDLKREKKEKQIEMKIIIYSLKSDALLL